MVGIRNYNTNEKLSVPFYAGKDRMKIIKIQSYVTVTNSSYIATAHERMLYSCEVLY